MLHGKDLHDYVYSGGGGARQEIQGVERTRMTREVFSFIEMGFFHISSAPWVVLPTASVTLPLLQLFTIATESISAKSLFLLMSLVRTSIYMCSLFTLFDLRNH